MWRDGWNGSHRAVSKYVYGVGCPFGEADAVGSAA